MSAILGPVVLTAGVFQVEFSVSDVEEIQWNEDLFDNIEMVGERKTLLRSLVETHVKKSFIEDFVEQKGTGLVLNFFGKFHLISFLYVYKYIYLDVQLVLSYTTGPPGVGKTLTAEGISESTLHVYQDTSVKISDA